MLYFDFIFYPKWFTSIYNADLYDDETGLGLDVYRYNIGGGEKENPSSRIWDKTRRTESFYVYNGETEEWEFDFTRDANAVRMMKYAVEYGADKVILFCNSPHYSMTKSGHASGGLTENVSNLPKENYKAFVDYVLTVADHFVSEGIPVYAVSPINEPQWSWGGDWVGQEGCHYTPEETVELLEMFASEMQKRNSPYKLCGTESGQITAEYYDYTDSFFESEILNSYCDTFSGHTYWLDGETGTKAEVGRRFAAMYPNKKYETSEWCELPLKTDSDSIDSGLLMANVILQDLTLLNAVSWQNWTAVNGDGLLKLSGTSVHRYNRYYAFEHFSRFIKPGMKRVKVSQTDDLATAAFTDGRQTVIIVINNGLKTQKLNLEGCTGKTKLYVTDAQNNCHLTSETDSPSSLNITGKSINTIVVG